MVKIVTDSASDIPGRIADQLGIPIVPARILFGRKSYKDRIDLDQNEFYKKLERNRYHPLTTQASPYDFYKVFRRIHEMGEDIICINVPEELSAFIKSARLARDRIPEANITIYSAGGVSGYQGILAIQAARMAEAGYETEEVLAQLDILQDKTIAYAAAATLDYLVRGGRVSVAKGRIGSLLGVIPILEINNNEVVQEDTQLRNNMDGAINKIIHMLKNKYSTDEPVYVNIMHAVNPSGAAKITDKMLNTFNVVQNYTSRIGATIGANVGPGTIGVAITASLPFMGE